MKESDVLQGLLNQGPEAEVMVPIHLVIPEICFQGKNGADFEGAQVAGFVVFRAGRERYWIHDLIIRQKREKSQPCVKKPFNQRSWATLPEPCGPPVGSRLADCPVPAGGEFLGRRVPRVRVFLSPPRHLSAENPLGRS